MSASTILRNIAQDDERAFDLFFSALDAALAAQPGSLSPPPNPRKLTGEPPLPASAFLDVLAERPGMFLQPVSVASLRAFLDGCSLASMEEDHFECVDLEGFEHWVRKKFDLKGMFRWENAIVTRFQGNEAQAFSWAVRELRSYRASKGPLSPLRYQVHCVGDISGLGAGTD